MGVLLDSSITIASERSGEPATELIRRVLARVGNQPLALSAIGYTEMIHGLYRTTTPAQYAARHKFISDLSDDLTIVAYSREAAEIAGRIDAQSRVQQITIPFPDLLIGATALSLGFSVLTVNVRHFRLIPGLRVIPF